MGVEKSQSDLAVSWHCETFFPKLFIFFEGPPFNFLISRNRVDAEKFERVPLLALPRAPDAPIRSTVCLFSGTVKENISQFKVLLLFLSLGYGADLCRSRFVIIPINYYCHLLTIAKTNQHFNQSKLAEKKLTVRNLLANRSYGPKREHKVDMTPLIKEEDMKGTSKIGKKRRLHLKHRYSRLIPDEKSRMKNRTDNNKNIVVKVHSTRFAKSTPLTPNNIMI